MAPAKASASSTFAETPTSSLSSPISLLWAHQLRREHSALLARLEEVTSAVTKVSTAQLKVAAQATRTEKKLTELESKHVKLENDLQRAVGNGKELDKKLIRQIDKLEVSENSTRDFQKEVRTFKETLRKDLLGRITAVQQRLDVNQAEQERQVQNLEAEICSLQNRLPDIINEGVIGVKDSMEQIREQMGQISRCAPQSGSRGTDHQAPHASGLVQPHSDQTEDMLTLQPNLNRAIDWSLRVSVDLDEDVVTPEPEVGVGDTVPGETMAMLAESPTSFPQKRQPISLKQGKHESWDRYLLAGESLRVSLPKRKEGVVVEAFVDGIYDEKVKMDCEKILDEAGWTWDGVKGFVEKYIAVEMETQAKQRTESLTHKHKRGEACPVCSGKSNTAHHEETSEAVADSPPQPALHQAVQLPQAAGPTRRSQRIHQQSQASSAAAAAVGVTKPEATKTKAPKPSKKAKVVTQEPASQNAVPKNVKAKPAEIGLGGEMSTRDKKKVITLQYGKQHPNLDAFTKESLNRTEKNTDTALPQKEMTPIQQIRPLPATNLEPTTPTHPISNQIEPDLAEEYMMTSTGALPAPTPQTSKKRKLVDQFEDPDPLAANADELVQQLDHQRVEQNEAQEPERKKRRKKNRGVVPPIPRIPILPLSDDD